MTNATKKSYSERRGFSLIELLVVIAIIGVLVGMILAGAMAMRDAARRKKAATIAQALVNASKAYMVEYGDWPGQRGSSDGTYTDWRPLMDELTNNPRKIDYFEMPPDLVYTNGKLMDPWGHAFEYALDENKDGKTKISTSTFSPAVNEDVNDGVAIMSWGSDKGRVYSWK